jgi:hypothetical protein
MYVTAALLLLAGQAAQEKPAPKFPVGRETTYFEGPLDKDGFIDYQTALSERLGKGITPETNANVLLWKALGPRPEGGRGMPAEFFKHLGIPEPPEKGDYLVGLNAYVRDYLKIDQAEAQAFYDQQSRASQRPWTVKDYPRIAAWLGVNAKPLAVAVEATKRPDYFNPLISFKSEKDPGSLIGVLLPHVQKCRELAAALTARAMLRTAEGKFDDAWQDLLACHRLGRLVARGGTLIEALVGIAIDAIAANAELAYLERANLTAKQVRDRLADLQKLPAMPSMADKVDLAERCMYLDCVRLVRSNGPGMLEGLAGGPAKKPDPKVMQAMEMIDWEPALRGGNRWYDRLAAAMRVKDRAEREKQLDKLEEELKALKKDAADPAGLARLFALGGGKPDKVVGKAIADVLISLMVPATRKVGSAADRAEQIQRNLHVAFALAAYHRDNKGYPAKLDELAPGYLAAVPGDVFSGGALIYRPEGNGYLLYSVGVNGKDDGGRWTDDNPPGDDPRVRMPLPELKPRN